MTMEPQCEAYPRDYVSAGMPSVQDGRYVYCVASTGDEVSLGAIGIEGREVYTVVQDSLSALVHDCPAQPYLSPDVEVAAALVVAHHRVVEEAWRRWGTVLPLTFNTLIKPVDGRSASENVEAWLQREYYFLKGKLGALVGKAEYGVQVFWDTQRIAKLVAGSSPGVRSLEEEIGSKPPGLAYLYRQKLQGLLRREIEAMAAEEFKGLFGRLGLCVESIRVDKPRRGEEGLQMLANLSCLVSTDRYPALEKELSQIGEREGFSVRMVGPLPPYSFC